MSEQTTMPAAATQTQAAAGKPSQPPKTAESIYDADYLAKNHKALGASFCIVSAALKLAGKDKATLKDAQKIVNDFKNKEVK